jgi:hypothetical protein
MAVNATCNDLLYELLVSLIFVIENAFEVSVMSSSRCHSSRLIGSAFEALRTVNACTVSYVRKVSGD